MGGFCCTSYFICFFFFNLLGASSFLFLCSFSFLLSSLILALAHTSRFSIEQTTERRPIDTFRKIPTPHYNATPLQWGPTLNWSWAWSNESKCEYVNPLPRSFEGRNADLLICCFFFCLVTNQQCRTNNRDPRARSNHSTDRQVGSIHVLEGVCWCLFTVAAIIELSIHTLPIIANQLGLVLESISKVLHCLIQRLDGLILLLTYKQNTQPSPEDANIPLDVLQSQLFVIRLLSACLQHHWSWYKKQSIQISRETNTTEEAKAAAAATGTFHESTIATTSSSSSISTLSAKSSYAQLKPDVAIDPPPLDESLVTFLLSLMSRFLGQMHVIEERNDQLSLLSSEHTNEALATASKVDSQSMEYIREVYTTSGKVLYYISASNWNSYYAKIKNAVNILGAVSESSDLNPPEVRILAFACLNIPKLHMILSGTVCSRCVTFFAVLIPSSHSSRFESVFPQHEDSGQAAVCKDDAHGHLEMDGNEALSVCRDLRQ